MVRAGGAAVAGLAALVTAATPAAAHSVGGGALPAPPWLLSYIGAFVVIVTAVALRASWGAPRLSGLVPGPIDETGPSALPHPAEPEPGITVGRAVGLVTLGLVGVAAVVGPDSVAANIAPVAVVVTWLVLPIACLLVGDVMRAVNPFVAALALARIRPEIASPRAAPQWTSAGFLGGWAWFLLAYHQPGSPRSMAVFLAAYALAALAGGWWWGRRWLLTGEAFGATSAAVALLSARRRRTGPPPGVAALMVVWLGSTAFDAFASTPFWVDVVGTSHGWDLTLLNTVGLAWLVAIVAAVYLAALRFAGADLSRPGTSDGDDALVAGEPRAATRLATPLGVALIPLAVGWFLAHELTLLLLEGQNLIVLLSDPLGRGWNLFGTLHLNLDYGIVLSRGVRWAQLAVLAVGHIGAVIVAHDAALALLRRRAAVRVTWAMAGAAVASVVAGALMVLG